MPRFKKSLKATSQNLKSCGKIAIYSFLVLKDSWGDSESRAGVETLLFSGLTIAATASLGITVPLGLAGATICVLIGTVHGAYSGVSDLIDYVVIDENPNLDLEQVLVQEQHNTSERSVSSSNLILKNLQGSSPLRIENFSLAMQEYIECYEYKQLNSTKWEEIQLTNQEKKRLIDYVDLTTNEIIDIPVTLNGRTYDLDTILMLLVSANKLDPYTGTPFVALDLIPDPEMALQIDRIFLQIVKDRQARLEKDVVGDNSVDVHEMNMLRQK